MSALQADLFTTIPTFSAAEVAQRLGVEKSRVGRLVQERALVALPNTQVLAIPKDCLVELDAEDQYVSELRRRNSEEPLLVRVTHQVVPHLRGTVLVLEDSRHTPEEIVAWLWGNNDWLGAKPIDLLRQGSHKKVNQIAALTE